MINGAGLMELDFPRDAHWSIMMLGIVYLIKYQKYAPHDAVSLNRNLRPGLELRADSDGLLVKCEQAFFLKTFQRRINEFLLCDGGHSG